MRFSVIIDRRGKYMQNFVFDPSYIHGQSRWKQSFRLVWYRENIVISNRLPRKMIFTPVPIPYRGFQIALFTVNEGIEWGGGGEKKTSRRRCIYSQRRKRAFKRWISRRGEYRNTGEAARLHRAMASIAIPPFDLPSTLPGKYPRKRSSAVVERFAFVVIGATIAIIAGSPGGKGG